MKAYTSTENHYWKEVSLKGGDAPYTGSLRTSNASREWQGFGGCFNEIGWDALQKVDPEERGKLLDLLFDPEADGCRFSYNRLPIGASDFALSWYSLNETPGDFAMEQFSIKRDKNCLIPYIREGLKRCSDMRLFASPWSPPTWMKFPMAHNFGNLIETPENLSAYALYFSRFLSAYREAGIDIHALHVQNEPAVSQKFPSCKFTGEGLRKLIAEYVVPHFKDIGEGAEVWLGTINSDAYNEYYAPILDSPAGLNAVSGIGVQWNAKNVLPLLQMTHPEIPVIQTENECGDGKNTWEYAQYVFNLARHYINFGVEAYVYWNFVLYEGGDSTWGWKQNSLVSIDRTSGSVSLNPEFYVMKHLSRFVPTGSRVLNVSGSWAAHALAFANPHGKQVLILHNPHPEAARVDGLSAPVVLPPESITTLVG
jgi:glucosylceramidase